MHKKALTRPAAVYPTKLNFTWEIVNICVPTEFKKKLVLYKMILGVIESSSRTLGDA